jgi:hypothetical protein
MRFLSFFFFFVQVFHTSCVKEVISGLVFNPIAEKSEFVTFGVKHIKFWRIKTTPAAPGSKAIRFGFDINSGLIGKKGTPQHAYEFFDVLQLGWW